jgi:hypothetical protein
MSWTLAGLFGLVSGACYWGSRQQDGLVADLQFCRDLNTTTVAPFSSEDGLVYGHIRGNVIPENAGAVQEVSDSYGVKYKLLGIEKSTFFVNDVTRTTFNKAGKIISETTNQESVQMTDSKREIFSPLQLKVEHGPCSIVNLDSSLHAYLPFTDIMETFEREGGGDVTVNVDTGSGNKKKSKNTSDNTNSANSKVIDRQSVQKKYLGTRKKVTGLPVKQSVTIIANFKPVHNAFGSLDHLDAYSTKSRSGKSSQDKENVPSFTLITTKTFNEYTEEQSRRAEALKNWSFGLGVLALGTGLVAGLKNAGPKGRE